MPVEFFVGRVAEIERLRKKVQRSLEGRLEIGFVVGERGIGKSSLASFVCYLCERDLRVLGLHTFHGGVVSLEEMVRRVFNRLLKESVETSWHEKIREFFGDRIRQVGLFGVSLEFQAPKHDLRRLAYDLAPALRNLVAGLKEEKKGLLLILDDINGLATSLEFANWFKSLVDEISTSREGLPLCLLLVGLEERRRSLISLQPSLARVFDIIDVRSWSKGEARDFFQDAFSKVGTPLDPEALGLLCRYAGGLPVLAHEIGDAVFNLDQDNHVDVRDANAGVIAAADIVGRKHLEPSVLRAIRSENYRSILRKLATGPEQMEFQRGDVVKRLKQEEQKVFDNFLRRMADLGVVERAPEQGAGAYRFANLLHYMYFRLEAARAERSRK